MTIDTKISQEVLDLADKISDIIGYNPDTAVVEGVENLYVTHLPGGLTPEHIKLMEDYNAVFLPAVALAVGDLGIERTVDGEIRRSLAAAVPMGNRCFHVEYNCHAYCRDSNNAVWPVHGEVTHNYFDPAVGRHNEDMVRVRDHLIAAATMALSE